MEQELPGIDPRKPVDLKTLLGMIKDYEQRISDLEQDLLQANRHMREFDDKFERHVQFELDFKKQKEEA